MRKYAVEDYPDAELFSLLAKLDIILLCAEQRVDFAVICGVIAVIFVSLKYRVEVNAAYAERLDIFKLLSNALQVAAEVVGICDNAVLVGSPIGLFVPVFV